MRPGNDRAVVTYNMNILQGIQAPETFCVTLNDTESINPARILGRFNYAHPQFTVAGLKHRAAGRKSMALTTLGSVAPIGEMVFTKMVLSAV